MMIPSTAPRHTPRSWPPSASAMAQTKRARPVLHAAQFFKQQPVVGFVDGSGASAPRISSENRAENTPGAPRERVHFQAGIVREQQAGSVAAVMAAP